MRKTHSSTMYSGFILFCTKTAQEQCLRQKQYTCAGRETVPTAKIKVGSIIFLYNVDDRSLLGPFTSLSTGGGKVDPGAWMLNIDEHSASENIKLEWESLHILEEAPSKLPFLNTPKTCELSPTQTQRALDFLKQSPPYVQERNRK